MRRFGAGSVIGFLLLVLLVLMPLGMMILGASSTRRYPSIILFSYRFFCACKAKRLSVLVSKSISPSVGLCADRAFQVWGPYVPYGGSCVCVWYTVSWLAVRSVENSASFEWLMD